MSSRSRFAKAWVQSICRTRYSLIRRAPRISDTCFDGDPIVSPACKRTPRTRQHAAYGGHAWGRLLLRDQCVEPLECLTRRRELFLARQHDAPVLERHRKLIGAEQAVADRIEHLHESRANDQDVHGSKAAGTQRVLHACEEAACLRTSEEHEQADGDDAVVFVPGFEVAQVLGARLDRKALLARALCEVVDAGRAGIERGDAASRARRSDRQIAQAAAEIQHLAVEMRQYRLLEWVQPVVARLGLSPELPIEELDRAVHVTGRYARPATRATGRRGCRRSSRAPRAPGRAPMLRP